MASCESGPNHHLLLGHLDESESANLSVVRQIARLANGSIYCWGDETSTDRTVTDDHQLDASKHITLLVENFRGPTAKASVPASRT